MRYFLKIFFVVLIFFLLFFYSKNVFAQSAIYNQPGQGLYECHDSGNISADYLKGGGVIVRWDALQPNNNDTIDETALTNLVNQIKLGGKKKYLHFQIYGGGGNTLPPWMNVYNYDCESAACKASQWYNMCKCYSDSTCRGAKGIIDTCWTPGDDLIQVINTAKGIFPKPWDTQYQGYLDKFLKLLSTKLREKGAIPYIDYIEPSMGGNWGGTNLWFSDNDLNVWKTAAGCTDFTCLGNRFTEGAKKVFDLYMADFPEFAMVIINDGCGSTTSGATIPACNFSGHQYLYNTYGSRVMLKAAGLGSNSDGACGYRNFFQPVCGNGVSFLTKCLQETGGPSKDANFFKDPCFYDTVFKNSLRTESISYYCTYDDDITSNPTTNQYVADHLGAQIEILSKSISVSEVQLGGQISINVNWRNTGSTVLSAPLKQGLKWTSSSYKLFVEFVKDSTVASYKEFDITPPTTSWGSADSQTINTFNIPESLGGSDQSSRTEYRVYIGLTDPNGEKVRFAVRNTDSNNDLTNRRYLVSNLTVVGRGVQITPTPTIPAGSCPSGNLGNIDCDLSGKIDETDLDILLSKWNTAPNPPTGQHTPDLDGSRLVDQADLDILLQNWNP